MAKDFHPLDVRYRGPSTAYTGKPLRERTAKEARQKTTFDAPPSVPSSGPWDRTAPPPVPPEPEAPIPLPAVRPRQRHSVLRVGLILGVLALFVGINIYAAREHSLLVQDIEDVLRPMTTMNAFDP